eukprot:10807070-Alexandrium_andersonii.AAC.1
MGGPPPAQLGRARRPRSKVDTAVCLAWPQGPGHAWRPPTTAGAIMGAHRQGPRPRGVGAAGRAESHRTS